MTKFEFCDKVGIKPEALTADDYKVIEYVYMYHPVIDAANGKQQIADIFRLPGGMRIIRDMVATAKTAEELSNRVLSLNRQMEMLRDELEVVQSQLRGLSE